MIKLIKFLES